MKSGTIAHDITKHKHHKHYEAKDPPTNLINGCLPLRFSQSRHYVGLGGTLDIR